MNRMKWIGILILCMLALQVSAQKKSKSKSKGATSVDPYSSPEVYSPKVSKKKKSSKITHNARDRYYDRVEMLEKKQRKNESNMDNPQYTDFKYFGHKKPPKKRPPEKMKYCKICGIRH